MRKALDEFVRDKKLQGLTEKAVTSYIYALNPFIKFCNCEIGDLTMERVKQYLEYTLSRNLSKATYSSYCRNIKTFLKYCQEQGYTDIDYTKIIVPKAPRRVVRLLPAKDVKDMLSTPSSGDYRLAVRNAAIMGLMYDSGLRQAEVCALKTEDIHFKEGYLILYGKGDKERYAPLGKTVVNLMLTYQVLRPARDCPYFFLNNHGKPLTENAIKLFVHRFTKKTGLDFSSHKLRHNFATNYVLDHYEQDGSVDIYKLMHLLGHEDIHTTEIYLHLAMDMIVAKNHLSHLDNL